jgi:hypothetical protein
MLDRMLEIANENYTKAYTSLCEPIVIDTSEKGGGLVNTTAIVKNGRVNSSYDDKKITTPSQINRGDLIVYKGVYYIVLSEINSKRYGIYYQAVIRKLTFDITIRFDVSTSTNITYFTQKGFITSRIVDEVTQTITVDQKKIKITLAQTPNTDKLTAVGGIDANYKLMGNRWDVEGVDKTLPGLAIVYCSLQY